MLVDNGAFSRLPTMSSTAFAHTFTRLVQGTWTCGLLALAACGGGGSPSPAPSTLSSAVGAWEDKTSPRKTLAALILPSGAHWLFYRNSSDSGLGFEQGTASATGSSLQASVMDYPNGFTARSVSVSAQIGNNTLTGTRSWTTGSDNFALTPMAQAEFDSAHAPLTNDIQGSWSGTLSSGSSSSAATFELLSNGSFTGSNSGCQYSGTLSPMNGTNAYQVSLNFVASTCSFTTASATGLAMAYHPSNTTTQLFVAVQDSTRQLGWLFTATR